MMGQARRAINAVDRCVVPGLAACVTVVLAVNWRALWADRAIIQREQAERLRPPRLTRTPRVSILVAAWNEERRITAHLDSFLAMRYPDCELLLCAGGSDRTFEVAARYAQARITVLQQSPGEGKQRALAHCLERASGEILYLTDADCLLNDEALLRLLEPIVQGGEAVTTGDSRPLDEQLARTVPFYIWASDSVANVRTPTHTEGLLGRNACVTRAALDAIGGLNFAAPTGTDYHLARRLLNAGQRIRHVGSSIVATEYPASLSVYRRKRSRWLRTLLIYGRQYRAQRDVLLTLRTVGVGMGMLLLPLWSLVLGKAPAAIWLVLLSHAVCARIRYARMAVRLSARNVPLRAWLSLVPLTLIDFGVWASASLDLLSDARRKRW